MKRILFLLFLLSVTQGFSQITCYIIPADTIYCYRDSCEGYPAQCVVFEVKKTGNGPFKYQWFRAGSQLLGDTNDVLAFSRIDAIDTGFYYCRVVNNSGDTCISNSGHLRMYPKININTFEIDTSIYCCLSTKDPVDKCIGKIKLITSGGMGPLTYTVDRNEDCYARYDSVGSKTLYGIKGGEHTLTITDGTCSISKIFYINIYKVPEVEYTVTPDTAKVFISNPQVTITLSDSSIKKMSSYTWLFGDGDSIMMTNPVSHLYKNEIKSYDVTLKYTTLSGCDSSIIFHIKVKPPKLQITDLITPNGDNMNETLAIRRDPKFPGFEGEEVVNGADYSLLDLYLSNELIILDRWGRKVYSKTNYNSTHSSQSKPSDIGDWNGDNLSDGTYFYILKCHGYYSDEVYKGSFTILH